MLLKSRKMFSMPGANARVRIYECGVCYNVYLWSYETAVLKLTAWKDGTYSLHCTGTYSKTTARHINRFTTEFFGTNLYFDCKAVCGISCVGWCKVHYGNNPDVYSTIMRAIYEYLNC